MKDREYGVPFELYWLETGNSFLAVNRPLAHAHCLLVFYVVPGFRTGTVEQSVFLNDRKVVIGVKNFLPRRTVSDERRVRNRRQGGDGFQEAGLRKRSGSGSGTCVEVMSPSWALVSTMKKTQNIDSTLYWNNLRSLTGYIRKYFE